MGHMLNNTLQDVLIRRARMKGMNACWVPGTDHASIATEAKVVARLREQGIEKLSLTRDEFMKHAWQWTDEHGGLILKQLRRLGASCDWQRTAFTMDETRSRSVMSVFVDLYNKGLIYRGVRMVNWDPAAQTALSDEEVIFRETHGKLYYLRYMIEEGGGYIVVATTRPETIMGDVAVCVNPNDPRYRGLVGRAVRVPLVNRTIPVIADDYVDMEFGTGVLKITPAHDVNDYMIGQKYSLEVIDVLNPDGTVNEKMPMYGGMDRFEVREQIGRDLEQAGLLEKVEDYTNNVGFSERTHVPIEPKLSMQWFLKMDKISGPALDAVEKEIIRFVPPKFRNTYRHWLENIKDWCISRQLWWGHRIPAWYLPDGQCIVAHDEAEALEMARAATGKDLHIEDLRQEEDVLDTWFSSWLWPISLFDGILNPENPEFKYYYPTNDLVTAPDIIFFWVARMIMAGYEFCGKQPFSNVYFTGIVRDKLGRKMSKSLGNSPDPLDLIDRYGADGVRVAMLLSSTAGNDIMFDEAMCEQGRNFGNKIWNAFRLVASWNVADTPQSDCNRLATEWFRMKLDSALSEVEADFNAYRISDAFMKIYKLFWDEFSGWYLEVVKPAFGCAIDRTTYDLTKLYFEKLLKMLHPFMPFVTEELWQNLDERTAGQSIMVSEMPTPDAVDENVLARFEQVKEIVTAIRNLRRNSNIANKEPLTLQVLGDSETAVGYGPVIMKMANLTEVAVVTEKDPKAQSFIVKATEYYVPMGGKVDVAEELRKLEDELKYTEGFLASVMKKLSNERFVANAPAKVVETEHAKKNDAEARIKALRERIDALK